VHEALAVPQTQLIQLLAASQLGAVAQVDCAVQVRARNIRLILDAPGTRNVGDFKDDIVTAGWRFPAPSALDNGGQPAAPRAGEEDSDRAPLATPPCAHAHAKVPATRHVRARPPNDLIHFKDRLLYLLQPPLNHLLAGRQVQLPFRPYPYQLEGIAFLMPRHAALLADEMGLGKTVQSILAIRLLMQAGLMQRVLLVCPKALVHNWTRELRTWAEDLPFEVIAGDAERRRVSWQVSNCPLKLVNYEILTRDAAYFAGDFPAFDLVLLDEAQRIKNRDSKTAQATRGIPRRRSWALTGTPVENRSEDLVNLFAFIDAGRVPPETPARSLQQLTGDCILRRTKEEVLADLPSKTIRDTWVELTPAQRRAYELAEDEGIVRLNDLGDTITVQHVFELVMRLKQICNFDPLTGESAKLEQLHADLIEVADSGRKAIIFSQWVEPLLILARELRDLGPLQFHGRLSLAERHTVLERFKNDPSKHVILMSYGTGSVGLNLQCANYVFLFDRWWNPAVEDQAINRVHRIGQRDPVFVTRFASEGTIEERIAEVLEKKRQLFRDLIEQNGAPPALGLTEAEIFGLFNINARPRRVAA
jgi:SNF2 family DNA or RNA helicase